MRSRFGPLLVSISVVGCSSAPATYDELPDALREVRVVATLEPGAVIPETATYSWMDGSFVRLDERYDAAAVERDILALVEAGLLRRGYHLVPGRGALLVGYAVAVEGALDGARLDAVYGLDRSATQHHERGALVLDIVDRDARRALWRGSAAILAEPTLPLEVRQERVRHGVESLLERLKPGY